MWTIQTGSPLFEAPIDQRYDQIVHLTTTPPPPPRHVLRQLNSDLVELDRFSDRLANFLADPAVKDPTSILHKTFEPGQGILIPNIYALASPGWEAYFRLNFHARTATGIYVRQVALPLGATLSSILAAL